MSVTYKHILHIHMLHILHLLTTVLPTATTLKLCADEPAHDMATLRQLLTVQSVRYNSHKLPFSREL